MNKHFIKTILCAFFLPLAPLFANFAYVGTTGGLTVIDTTTNSVVQTISLGADPTLSAVSPNNLYVYATELNDNRVGVVSTASNTLYSIIDVPGNSTPSQPLGVAFTPDGEYVYVTCQGDNSVQVISTATNTIIRTYYGFNQPWGIAITPDGKFAYIVNLAGGTSSGYLCMIDLQSNTFLPNTIPVGTGPTAIVITPDGQYGYVTNENSNDVSVIEISSQSVISTIPVGINPFQVTSSADSQFIYVSNNAYSTSPPDTSISVISSATNTVIDTILLSTGGPSGLAVTPDGETLYVTYTGGITLISTATNQIIGTIPLSNLGNISMSARLVNDLKGQQKINNFGLAYEYYNHLYWKPILHSQVIAYNIYRNGEYVTRVNGLQFEDHNRQKNVPVTYTVAPVEASGNVGSPLMLVLP